jgi:Na+/proline symporter
MITGYDYAIIGFYLLFMLAIGVVFRRMSKNTSDYFRAGGAMPWWLTGVSAWIFSFSAWTFTGAAGKVYETGTLVLVVFYATIFALLFSLMFTSVRFRRMRVITWMEAVRARYGAGTEQFYTWVLLLLRLFFAGVSLNAIGVFMAAVFHMEMNTLLIVLGIVVTVVAFAGGSWAVLASDFVQAFLIVTITLCTAALVLARAEIGGLSGLLHKVPTAHLHWNELARPELIGLWITATLWLKITDENNIERSTMYLMTRSDRDARMMVLIPLIGTLLGPLVWFIPSMAATILHPNLAAEYPGLVQPHEAAFVAVALDVMPQGLLGLLLSAMLGATVTAMDAGLNKNVGICIRSFYRPVLRPDATEHHLLVAGKICTLLFGVLIVGFALLVNRFRGTNLFDFVNQLAANLIIPMGLPLIYGLYYKRTPGWAAWSTALIACAASWILGDVVTPEIFQKWAGSATPLNADEATYLRLAVSTLGGTVIVGSVWYFFTTLFYRASSSEYRSSVDGFFDKLRTPVEKHGQQDVQASLYRLLGALCLVYGLFILLLMAIPNPFFGRLCFLFCGGLIAGAGGLLLRLARRTMRAAANEG